VHVAQKSVVEFQEDTGHSLAKVKEFKNRITHLPVSWENIQQEKTEENLHY